MVAGVAFPAFIVVQKVLGLERAMLPLEIFKSFSVYAICCVGFMGRWVMFVYVYYVPLFYQAVRGHSATDSGVDILALMLATVVAVIAAGRLVGIYGYYWCAPPELQTRRPKSLTRRALGPFLWLVPCCRRSEVVYFTLFARTRRQPS